MNKEDKEERRDREDPSVLILDRKTVAQLLRKAQKLRRAFTGRGADSICEWFTWRRQCWGQLGQRWWSL